MVCKSGDLNLITLQGLHAGTNIALDIDQRLMPRGPMFPRSVVLCCSLFLSSWCHSGGGGGVRDAPRCKIRLGLRYRRDPTRILSGHCRFVHSSYVFFVFTDNKKRVVYIFPTVFAVCHVRFLPLAIVASNELLRYLVSVLSSIFFFNGFFLLPLVLAADESHCPSVPFSILSRQKSP